MGDKSSTSCSGFFLNLLLSKSIQFYVTILSFFLFSMLSVSCTSKLYRDFDLVDQGYRLNPDKIVVLPGTLREQDLMLASKISEYLKKESSFEVVSFDEVDKKIPDYKNIMTDFEFPDIKNDNSKVHYLSKKNIRQVNAVNKTFKSKYVFLVWSSDLVKKITTDQYGGEIDSDYEIKVYGRLIAYPKSDVVGYSINEYSESKNESFLSFLDITRLFKSSNDKVVDFLESCGDIIGYEIIRVSNGSEKGVGLL